MSLDLLNTTLASMSTLKGGFINQFATRKPLWRKLLEPNKVSKAALAGTKYEIPYGFGAPSKAVKLTSGTEQPPLTISNTISKFSVESQRHLAVVSIPMIDLDRNSGKLGIIKLIETKPAQQVEAMLEDYEYWFLTGAYRSSTVSAFDSPELDGFPTLNGNVTSSSTGDGGWLQMVAPASQSGNFQGVARSNAQKLVNQYGTITSFASDGMPTVRRVLSQCAQYSRKGGVDFGFADGITYANIQANIADNVRIASTDESVDGVDSFEYLLVGRTKIYNCDANLDPTNSSFSGTTGYSTSDITGGVLYLVDSAQLELAFLKDGAAPKFVEAQGQDVVMGKVKFDMVPLSDMLACHGVVSGGRIP